MSVDGWSAYEIYNGPRLDKEQIKLKHFSQAATTLEMSLNSLN